MQAGERMRLAAFWTPKEVYCKPRQCRIFKLILVRNDVIVRADRTSRRLLYRRDFGSDRGRRSACQIAGLDAAKPSQLRRLQPRLSSRPPRAIGTHRHWRRSARRSGGPARAAGQSGLFHRFSATHRGACVILTASGDRRCASRGRADLHLPGDPEWMSRRVQTARVQH